MKKLALLRHAKSVPGGPGVRDFDRALNTRGVEAARRMGEEIRSRGWRFDLVLASSARRVQETVECVEAGYGRSLAAEFVDSIYDASAEALTKLVQGVGDDVENVLIVGHNPGLQEFACKLAMSGDPRGSMAADHFPTAALLLLELPARRWRDLTLQSASIVEFVQPRDPA